MDLFDLEKELAQSKININLNENKNDGNKNKFLTSKIWESLEDLKIAELDEKVESIYKGLNKENIKILKEDIDKNNLENYFKGYPIYASYYPIGCLENLNSMVESTFMNGLINNEIINSDIEELTPYLFKFRRIKGDGDCFYRSLIFSFLENIIFNNQIMQLKELLILYNEKMNKNNKLINQKEYLKIINEMNISIVSEILYIIINQLETDISKAYIILLKAFLFCNSFDFSIIFFTRYLIYEYISTNENKIYSKEFQIEVGSLLPDDFIIDKGNKNEYCFENYYSLYLMKPKTFAEKIVIYVAPFVFNIKMNILMYNYGNNIEKSIIQEKKFLNENGNKNKLQAQINLLFRKAHYDVYYKFDEYEDFKKYFDIFSNKLEEGHFQKENHFMNDQEIKGDNDLFKNNFYSQMNNDLLNKNNNSNDNNNVSDNKINNNFNTDIIINRQYNLNNNKKSYDFNENCLDLNDNNNNSKNNNKYNDENNINKNNNCENKIDFDVNDNDIYLSENKINYGQQKCKICKINYIEFNKFNLCDKCLYTMLKKEVFSVFLKFLKDITNLVKSEEKFNYLIKNIKCKISMEDNITIKDLIKNSNYKLEDILLDIRSHMCLACAKEIKNRENCFVELPCKCRICCAKCFIIYLNIIGNHIALSNNNPAYFRHITLLTCFCGFIYNTQNILYMIKEMEKRELNYQKGVYQNYLYDLWNWRCFLCRNNFENRKNYVKVVFECEDIDKKLLNQNIEFKHLLCDECLPECIDLKGKNIFCKICELNHKINSLIKVNEYNEETNLIDF